MKSCLPSDQQILFDRCYSVWPGRKDRGPAEKAWKGLKFDKVDADWMVEYLGKLAEHYRRNPDSLVYLGGFAPFLNQKKYRNEIEVVGNSTAPARVVPKCAECDQPSISHNHRRCAYHESMRNDLAQDLRDAYKRIIDRHGKDVDWKGLYQRLRRGEAL